MALADLRKQFGEQKILSLKELGPLLGKSEGALVALRYRDRFPLPTTPIGGKVTVSIYDVALLLAGELKMPKKKKKASTAYRTLEDIRESGKEEAIEKAKAAAKFASKMPRSLFRGGKPVPWGNLIDPLS
jgi:hypothetical protein